MYIILLLAKMQKYEKMFVLMQINTGKMQFIQK